MLKENGERHLCLCFIIKNKFQLIIITSQKTSLAMILPLCKTHNLKISIENIFIGYDSEVIVFNHKAPKQK